MLDRKNTSAREVLDLSLSVLFPVLDVWVVAHAQRTAGEDDGAHVVVVTGCADGFLVRLGRAGLFAQNEASADPDGRGAEHQCCCETLTVEDTTGGDHLDWLAAHWALVAFAHRGDGWNENGGWDISGVALSLLVSGSYSRMRESLTTSLTTLRADHISSERERLWDVLWVTDHVHVKYTGLVKLLDDVLWWHTNSADEKSSTRFDDDINQVVQLALGVVVARMSRQQLFEPRTRLYPLGLAGTSSDLRKQKINTEWCLLVMQVALEFGDLLAKHVWGVADTSNDTDTAGVGDCGRELWSSCNVHTSEHDRVSDTEHWEVVKGLPSRQQLDYLHSVVVVLII